MAKDVPAVAVDPQGQGLDVGPRQVPVLAWLAARKSTSQDVPAHRGRRDAENVAASV
ncbi:MAG: hypothetical protein WKF82_03190 [Nocardioidaceae bacterium]